MKVLSMATALFLTSASAFGTELEGETIEIGVRARGSHQGRDAPLERVRRVRLDDLSLVRVDRFDAQARERRSYLGIELSALIRRHPGAASYDLALLHFSNGMIVPVSLSSGKPDVEVFVARASTFPTVNRKNVLLPDSRPIGFGANKIVVSDLALPFAPDPIASSFSPWAHVDTLIAIELVERDAWESQFDAGSGDLGRGRAVFLERCQYCHAVSDVGGKFGWDFVVPTPLFEYRGPNNLYPHVRFSNTLAAEAGAMMPRQQDVEPDDMTLLWRWMRAISKSGPKPYSAP